MATQLKSAVPTPAGTTSPEVTATVSGIIADIRQRGDAAVREYSEKLRPLVPTVFRLEPTTDRARSSAPCRGR